MPGALPATVGSHPEPVRTIDLADHPRKNPTADLFVPVVECLGEGWTNETKPDICKYVYTYICIYSCVRTCPTKGRRMGESVTRGRNFKG